MKRLGMFCLLFVAISAHAAKNVVVSGEVTRTRVSVPRVAKTELVLCNIRFEKHPGTQFHVVLERRDDRTKRERVGTLSFYANAKGPFTRSFDVTDELRELGRGDIDVVLEATSGRGGSSEATVDGDMKLTIGEIKLRAKK